VNPGQPGPLHARPNAAKSRLHPSVVGGLRRRCGLRTCCISSEHWSSKRISAFALSRCGEPLLLLQSYGTAVVVVPCSIVFAQIPLRLQCVIAVTFSMRGMLVQLNAPIRILVADDFEPYRRSICSMIRQRPDLTVIAEAQDGLEAIRQAEILQPRPDSSRHWSATAEWDRGGPSNREGCVRRKNYISDPGVLYRSGAGGFCPRRMGLRYQGTGWN